jgi:antirestriction protein ArdC
MPNPHLEVTARIVVELEAGTPPWIQPWSRTPGANIPCNAVTGRAYSGVNRLLLWTTRAKGWLTPRFLTFKQAQAAGGHVRKGEHGCHVVFVKDLPVKDSDNEEEEKRYVRMPPKYFVVFNVAQIDGLPDRIAKPLLPKPRHFDGRDPFVEEFLTTTGAKIHEGGADCVYWGGTTDRIDVPPFVSFDSAAAYYASLFHELAHWTGAKHRLARDLAGRFRTEQQKAAEELIAELTSAFLCAEFSIDGYSGHTGYIAHWIELLKSDPKAIFTCANRAQAAVDYLRELALRAPAQAAE